MHVVEYCAIGGQLHEVCNELLHSHSGQFGNGILMDKLIGASASEPHTSLFYCDFSYIYIIM